MAKFDIIYGKNVVKSALKAGRVNKLYLSKNLLSSPLEKLAHDKGVKVEIVDISILNRLTSNAEAQGVAAEVKPYETITLGEMISSLSGAENPLLVILDGIEDPHNLGAIMRSVDALGADGMIIKNHNASPLNATVAKVSTGAINYVKVANVGNLSQAIRKLKEEGYWIVGTSDAAKDPYTSPDYKRKIALVIGSEGKGASHLVLKECDYLVQIPMKGHVECLNASVAAGILMAEIVRARSL